MVNVVSHGSHRVTAQALGGGEVRSQEMDGLESRRGQLVRTRGLSGSVDPETPLPERLWSGGDEYGHPGDF